MLFILILVHLFSKNSSAAPVPHPLDARTSTNTCDDINKCRKLSDVVWGCLATIFACTWVSVHLNVAPPNQGCVALLWRRVKMMLIAIIAPEVMVGFAVRQFMGVRVLLEGYPIATIEQLRGSVELQHAIHNVDIKDITARSREDALSKGVALAQGLWFTTQCLARVHQGLAVTELEVATLGFAVVNIFIWALWWNKPLDVQQPIVIVSPESPSAQPITPAGVRHWTVFWRVLGGYDPDEYDVLSSTSVPSFWTFPVGSGIRIGSMVITALVGSVFGAIHCAAWNASFPTATEMWMWRYCSAVTVTAPAALSLGPALMVIDTQLKILALVMEMTWLRMTLLFIELAAFASYIPARLVLIVLPFIELRSLPPSAFMDVNWSRYIPHI